MALVRGPRFHRRKDGRYSVRLHENERALLASLPTQLNALLDEGDASLARLFPPAYVEHLDHDREFQRLMHDDLLATKRESAEILAATAQATVLDEAQLMRWMGAINDLRLVIGTQLDVGEDTEEEDYETDEGQYRFAVYRFLSVLLGLILQALQSGSSDDSPSD
jgi:hypothetical protein